MDPSGPIPFDLKEDTLCCCKKDCPHDESMKFVLLATDENKNKAIFGNRRKGELIQLFEKNLRDRVSNISDERFLIGRNKEIQRCVSMLNNEESCRLVIIGGVEGDGGVHIAKYTAKYCSTRNYFKDGAYEIDTGAR